MTTRGRISGPASRYAANTDKINPLSHDGRGMRCDTVAVNRRADDCPGMTVQPNKIL